MEFICWINSSEATIDKYENIVFLTEVDQLNNCNGNATIQKVGECLGAFYDVVVPVTNALALVNRPQFQTGGIYYFTSKLTVLVQVMSVALKFKYNEMRKIVK